MKLLVLTDFPTHKETNAVYSMVRALLYYDVFDGIDVASRGSSHNEAFFNGNDLTEVYASPADISFSFPQELDSPNHRMMKLDDYDFIWLRIPRPIAYGFFEKLEQSFDADHIINRPSGIEKTGSKGYLLNFPEYTAPTALCNSFRQIADFLDNYDAVLKPLENYGGAGIVKIVDGEVEVDGEEMDLDTFQKRYESHAVPYLAMEYLKNVALGDKRIVVVNGEIMLAALRLPKEGGWLCNIAQGGSAQLDEVTAREKEIVEHIAPILKKEGIMMFGLDTLVDNNGNRVISEINTLSIGGIHEVIHDPKAPEAERFAEAVKKYINDRR